MQDVHVTEQEVTPEMMDRYPAIVATAGDRSCVDLRPDRRAGRVYHRDTEARDTDALPTLWIRVPDYEYDTISRLQSMETASMVRRLNAVK